MVKSTIEATIQCFKRLDLVVNKAGIMIAKPISELSSEDWNKVISINHSRAGLSQLCPQISQRH
jgi:NAD(P)-dependent dehydrogenase (short-subunit alcohol dehydrogenase family)